MCIVSNDLHSAWLYSFIDYYDNTITTNKPVISENNETPVYIFYIIGIGNAVLLIVIIVATLCLAYTCYVRWNNAKKLPSAGKDSWSGNLYTVSSCLCIYMYTYTHMHIMCRYVCMYVYCTLHGRIKGTTCALFSIKCKGAVAMDKKAQLWSYFVIVLLNSAFQKVTIAFLHTSITLDSWLWMFTCVHFLQWQWYR